MSLNHVNKWLSRLTSATADPAAGSGEAGAFSGLVSTTWSKVGMAEELGSTEAEVLEPLGGQRS